jgi:ribosomal protein L40E
VSADTSCRKCGHTPKFSGKLGGSGPFANCTFTVTAYLCEKCGHYNNLKRRKPRKPSMTAPLADGREVIKTENNPQRL